MADPRPTDQGKLEFVTSMLRDDPKANERAVKQAWSEAGREGTISGSYVTKIRAKLGLTDGSRSRRKAEPAADGPRPRPRTQVRKAAKPVEPSAPEQAAPTPTRRNLSTPTQAAGDNRRATLAEIEADVDRALFRVMQLGNLAEIEDALRTARRRLILESGR